MISDSSLVPFDLAQEKIKALVFLFFISQLFPVIKLIFGCEHTTHTFYIIS
jgi:hypothetical protein